MCTCIEISIRETKAESEDKNCEQRESWKVKALIVDNSG